jgi:hypothetical protein
MGSIESGSGAGSYLLYATNADTVYRCDLGERISSTAKITFLTIGKIEQGILCCTIKPASFQQAKMQDSTGAPLSRRLGGVFGSGTAFVVISKNGIYVYQEGAAKGNTPLVTKIPDLEFATRACWYHRFLVLIIKKKDEEIVKILELNDRYLAFEFSLKNSVESLFSSKIKPRIIDIQTTQSQVNTNDNTSQSEGQVILTIQLSTSTFVISLNEKSDETKLELLRKKFKYKFAINLAKTITKIDYDSFSKDIRKQYGDYLFSKGEYQDAIQQYILTIGSVEPSYVIRKFLDSQRNTYLIQYLYILHKRRRATHEHTTLLLNCFMRLDNYSDDDSSIMAAQTLIDDKKSIKFHQQEQLKAEQVDEVDEEDGGGMDESLKELMRAVEKKEKKKILENFKDKYEELNYDQVTAISVMRKNGYREQALALAETFGAQNPNEIILHDWVIKIYIEDFPEQAIKTKSNFQKALYHIESLERGIAMTFMLKYGKVLVTELPQNATNVLIRLCCNYTQISIEDGIKIPDERRIFILPEKRHLIGSKSLNHIKARSEDYDFTLAANYIFAFADQPFWLMVFLEVVMDYMFYHYKKKNISLIIAELSIEKQTRLKTIYNTLLELYLRALSMEPQVKDLQSTLQYYIERVLPSSAPNLPVTTILSPQAKDHKYQEDSYHIYPVFESQLSNNFATKAQNIITDAIYDQKHALVLCQAKGFEPGILYLYEKLDLKYDIIQYFMDKEAEPQDHPQKFKNILDCCKTFGRNDPNMWIQVLTYFVSGPGYTCRKTPQLANEYIDKVLVTIKELDVLPPLVVVQILSQRDIELRTIKDYLSDKLSKEQKKIKDQNTTINELQRDTEKLKADINELRTSAKIFQLTQCSYCSKPLDLPAVHFMCMHSYHQRCLENEECPRCASKNKEYLQNMRTKQKNKLIGQNGEDITLTAEEKQDSFFKMLENAKQGFETVAKQFGTGLFPIVTIDESKGPK